ncbi:MAG: serine/threonine protein kinase [Deltaproteobacteria bacterium]|nr:serine/threonine protein kinase [Deltaproteobacteria bacterium]
MAVVYRGRDSALDREVAVKLLHPHLAARAESRARFSREARAVARLSHPNIVEIYDYAGDAALESFLVTEFVRGRTLRAFFDQAAAPLPELGVLLARALADALAHAHAAGVIHRDLKPENVLMLEDGPRRAVKLADFGIARIVTSDERMTLTGALVGSPNHMAPEIIEGREATARSDVFSLGTILYWLATGRMPFAAPNPTATLRRVIEGRYDDPRSVSPLVSDELAAIVSRSLALDPEERFASAAELREALDALLAEEGLARPSEELAAYLTDPAGYARALVPRLVATLSAAAEAALAKGASARALRLWNRVLVLDPGNRPVLAALRRLEGRARLWRLLGRAGLAAGAMALAVLVGLAAYALRPGASRTAPPAAALPAAAAPREEPREEPPAPASSTPAPRAAEPGPRPAPRPPPAPPATVLVLVRPYAQRALLDGVEVARGAQQVRVELERGRGHRLEVLHDCCTPFVREFPAGEAIPQPLELKVPLQPLPALLRVQADPRALVFVGGRRVGTAEESQRAPIPIPVPADAESPYEGDTEIRIEAPGRPVFATTVRVRAGAVVAVVAPDSEVTR